ncbi:unnamed protein product, partial [Rotaria magnacalcarata]
MMIRGRILILYTSTKIDTQHTKYFNYAYRTAKEISLSEAIYLCYGYLALNIL